MSGRSYRGAVRRLRRSEHRDPGSRVGDGAVSRSTNLLFGFTGAGSTGRTEPGWLRAETMERVFAFAARVADAYDEALNGEVPPSAPQVRDL